MEPISINQYKLEKKYLEMTKMFGKIDGHEIRYDPMLLCMEGNMLKMRHRNPVCTSRRVTEAINMALMTIHGYIVSEEYDFGNYWNDGNTLLYKALMKSFDPFTNEEVSSAIMATYDFSNTAKVREYFIPAIQCLLRIRDSVEFWIKKEGADGYFNFIEEQLSKIVDVESDKMEFAVLIHVTETHTSRKIED